MNIEERADPRSGASPTKYEDLCGGSNGYEHRFGGHGPWMERLVAEDRRHQAQAGLRCTVSSTDRTKAESRSSSFASAFSYTTQATAAVRAWRDGERRGPDRPTSRSVPSTPPPSPGRHCANNDQRRGCRQWVIAARAGPGAAPARSTHRRTTHWSRNRLRQVPLPSVGDISLLTPESLVCHLQHPVRERRTDPLECCQPRTSTTDHDLSSRAGSGADNGVRDHGRFVHGRSPS